MNIRLAKDLDNRTDVLYFIADLVETAGIDESTAEKVAEIMIDDTTRKQLLNQLKTVKDLPSTSEEKNDECNSNKNKLLTGPYSLRSLLCGVRLFQASKLAYKHFHPTRSLY